MKKKKNKPIAAYFLCLICLILMVLLRRLWPVRLIIGYPLNLLGLGPLILGLAIGMSAVVKFLKERTNIHPFKKPDKLVTDGVYRYGRNPMYLGLALILAGSWILLGAVSPLAGVLIFVAISDRYYIPPEEQMLGERFGESYENYRRAVRRWL
jgi:protein-S-isoprenylcysteine O-methyltransferase Ste14